MLAVFGAAPRGLHLPEDLRGRGVNRLRRERQHRQYRRRQDPS
jgi:hypothetical protein